LFGLLSGSRTFNNLGNPDSENRLVNPRRSNLSGADAWRTQLSDIFGDRLKKDVLLAGYTAARIGGPADSLLVAGSSDELADFASQLWEIQAPFLVLGGGSNVLVSDEGVRGVVILNRAREVRFDQEDSPPTVWAESGANFGATARQATSRGLAGLEWATGIPGTVGGAVIGNAGAHGGDVAGNLRMAKILHRDGRRERWPVERLGYAYRSSVLKRTPFDTVECRAIVLEASFYLKRSTPEDVQQKVEAYTRQRQRSQPPGASMGSMFKNPLGDYAGRLIDAAGLKGTRVGGAEISTLHANFFINRGEASAANVFELIELARETVARQFNVNLELEIELIGEWPDAESTDG
jgi:UDP-N-acetylmuramate dehydrogenase